MNVSTNSTEFLTGAQRWISERGEILALFRYSGAAGSQDFFYFESPEVFRAALRRAGPQTSVVIFRQRQLPLRGTVDEDLIRAARELIPDDAEFLILDLEPQEGGWSHHTSGVGHRELEESLNEMRGHRVALGRYPPWLYDSEDVMEAIVPDRDGVVRRGIY
jgi:hypothetical protein